MTDPTHQAEWSSRASASRGPQVRGRHGAERDWVGASIPTLDDDVRKHFEPRAASVPERLDMLREFKRAGVKRCVVVQPMLPGDPIALADALAEVVESVSIGVLRGELGADKDFADPRYAHARDEAWQRQSAFALRDALVERGVDVWVSELPPQLGPSD